MGRRMIALVALAQVADLAGYLVAVRAGHLEGNPLMASLPPDLVVAAKLIGLAAVLVGVYALPPRLGRLVGLVAVALGLMGAASAVAVMA